MRHAVRLVLCVYALALQGVSVRRTRALLARPCGVLPWLCSRLLPLQALTDVLCPPAELCRRPAELCSGMASCMQQICLGEAQAVVCHRAEERGTSAATLAALHMGASDLFEAAAKALKEHTGERCAAGRPLC